MMTKKDYIVIAKAIHELYNEGAMCTAVERVAYSLSHYLRSDNPRFDTQRFVTACIEGTITERANTKVKHQI